MAGIKALRKIQIGAESTAGTAVAASVIWRGMGLLEDGREVKRVDEEIGYAMPTTREYIPKLACKITLDPVEATCQYLPYFFEAGVSIATPTQDGGGTGSGYIYQYAMPTTSANTIRPYTVEAGDNQLAQESDYCFVESFKISGNAAEGIMMEGVIIGRDVVDTTFTGGLTPIALVPGDHLVFGGSKFYIDAVTGTIGTTEVTSTLLSFELDVTTGYKAKWTNLGKDFDFVYWDRGSFSATLKLVYEHNASADAQRDLYEAATPRQIRLKFEGPALQTPATYNNLTFIIDCAGTYTAMPASDLDGNATVEAEMLIGYDLIADLGLEFLVVIEDSDLFA